MTRSHSSTRTESLVDRLRQRIVGGELAPGHRLPSENQLVAEHGVSRTVVREAVQRLQAEGLVHTRRGSGSFVLTPPAEGDAGTAVPRGVLASSVKERLELIDYRVAIESEAAALAASRRSPALVEAVARAELDFAESAVAEVPGRPVELLGLDFAFHRAVAVASGNALLLRAVDGLGPSMIAMPRRRLSDTVSSTIEGGGARTFTCRAAEAVHEHAAVASAVADGDVLGAAAAMRAHLRNTARRIVAEC